MVCGGGSPNSTLLYRLLTNGMPDFNFPTAAIGTLKVLAIAYQPDGRLLIGGAFSAVRGQPRNRIARLNADGTLDTTFNPGTGADSDVNALALLPDGRIYAGGSFMNFNGVPHRKLVRLLPDGSVDVTFNVQFNGNGAVVSLITDGFGRVYASGSFTN